MSRPYLLLAMIITVVLGKKEGILYPPGRDIKLVFRPDIDEELAAMKCEAAEINR